MVDYSDYSIEARLSMQLSKRPNFLNFCKSLWPRRGMVHFLQTGILTSGLSKMDFRQDNLIWTLANSVLVKFYIQNHIRKHTQKSYSRDTNIGTTIYEVQ